MSKVAIKGNASGTGTFTLEAPNSNTDRTLTLPDEAGTVLTSGGAIGNAIDANASAPANSVAIDSAGRLTLPYQPAFCAKATTGSITSTAAKINFNTTHTNIGSHWDLSNDRFTCPVSGVYLFSWSLALATSSLSLRYCAARLYINGSEVHAQHSHVSDETGNSDYTSVAATMVLNMSANDYLEVWADAASNADITSLTSFSGYLIG